MPAPMVVHCSVGTNTERFDRGKLRRLYSWPQFFAAESATEAEVATSIAIDPQCGQHESSVSPSQEVGASSSDDAYEATAGEDAVLTHVLRKLEESIISHSKAPSVKRFDTWLQVDINSSLESFAHQIKTWSKKTLDHLDTIVVATNRADPQPWGLKVRFTIASLPDGVLKKDVCSDFSEHGCCRRKDKCHYYHPQVHKNECLWYLSGECRFKSRAQRPKVVVKYSKVPEK